MRGAVTLKPDPMVVDWDKYLLAMEKRQINESARRWHVIRARQYLTANPGRAWTEHNPQLVRSYLESAGRRDVVRHQGEFQCMVNISAGSLNSRLNARFHGCINAIAHFAENKAALRRIRPQS